MYNWRKNVKRVPMQCLLLSSVHDLTRRSSCFFQWFFCETMFKTGSTVSTLMTLSIPLWAPSSRHPNSVPFECSETNFVTVWKFFVFVFTNCYCQPYNCKMNINKCQKLSIIIKEQCLICIFVSVWCVSCMVLYQKYNRWPSYFKRLQAILIITLNWTLTIYDWK